MIDADKDWATYGVLVSTWQGHSSWSCTSAAGNCDLVARDVELRSVCGAGYMEGDDFCAQQIVTWCNVGLR